MTPAPLHPIRPYETIVDEGGPFGPRLFRPLVYAFEHLAGPRQFFTRHLELQRAPQPTRTQGDAFIHVWSGSALECEECEPRGWWPQGLTADVDVDADVGDVAPLWREGAGWQNGEGNQFTVIGDADRQAPAVPRLSRPVARGQPLCRPIAGR